MLADSLNKRNTAYADQLLPGRYQRRSLLPVQRLYPEFSILERVAVHADAATLPGRVLLG
jgi:hypothetical protein